LRREAFTVCVDEWRLYGDFIAIYRQTMDHVRADAYYYFTESYFAELENSLRGHLHLFSVVAPEGRVAAAGLFTERNGIVQFHLGGTAADYWHCAPSKLLFESAIFWAKRTGYRALHLGGGVGTREDTLFHFKAGFSELRAPYQTWRIIVDQARYGQLLLSAESADIGADDYFPAYRKRV
jgi:lipid II:glycine glycyltransferase (peptidoglycan interpeptide bridge formation enzyme)